MALVFGKVSHCRIDKCFCSLEAAVMFELNFLIHNTVYMD